MGNCMTGENNKIRRTTSTSNQSNGTGSENMHEQELYLLHLMFADLAERVEENKVNLQNFLLFFHKNCFWGESLFKEFKLTAGETLISEESFLEGVERICKCSEKEKIKLLFKFFAHEGEESAQGVGFHNFLTMLYNYPKEDLEQILNDKEFIEYELKNHLMPVVSQKMEKGDLFYCLENTMNIRLFHPHRRNYKRRYLTQKLSAENIDTDIPSLIGREIARNLQKRKGKSEHIIKLNYQDRTINVKAINIQQLTKLFALKMFKEAKIDTTTGKLTFDQFFSWICNHRALYENYFRSFHNQLWEFNLTTSKPNYLSINFQKRSNARFQFNNSLLDVKLMLHQCILIVCKANCLDHPFMTICLGGLSVRRIFEQAIGFGIQISHRDGYYKDKRFFFKNEEVLLEWLNMLQFCKANQMDKKYQIGEKIGEGRFSVVYRCLNLEDQQEYALKEIATYKLNLEMKNIIAHETSIMQVISHPLLLEFKECILTKTHQYIITEMVRGTDLCSFVKKRGTLKEQEAAKLCQQIIIGIRFLHSFDIVHRDLKPQNIMVAIDQETEEAQNIKIIDFGLSNYISSVHENKDECDSMVGTPNYIAPEILKQQPFDFKIDNFAIGVILYFMLIGQLPFWSLDVTETLKNIMSGTYSFPQSCDLSENAKSLINRLLKNDPKQRISLEQALQHEWFNSQLPSGLLPVDDQKNSCAN